VTTVKGNAGGAQVDAPLFAYVRNGSAVGVDGRRARCVRHARLIDGVENAVGCALPISFNRVPDRSNAH